MENYKSVDECIKAGHSWSDCVSFKIDDNGKMKGEIKKTCPIIMREELKQKVFAGEDFTFTTEK